MRACAIVLASGLALAAVPAWAQTRTDDNGAMGNVLRQLNNAVNGQNAPNQNSTNPNATRGYTQPYNERSGGRSEGREQGYGTSNAPGGNMSFRSEADVQAEQRRLDGIQTQINNAQRQLDQEYRSFEQARRSYEGQR